MSEVCHIDDSDLPNALLYFTMNYDLVITILPSGITHEEMVQESKRHWQRLEQNAQKQQKVRGETWVVYESSYRVQFCVQSIFHILWRQTFTTRL